MDTKTIIHTTAIQTHLLTEIVSYSKYPTEDKKYECRTGTFEGFFVSSVEFCKHKFDDKKDHNRDNRTSTSLYTVVGNTTAGSAGTEDSTIISTATCDQGDVTTGGSFIVTGNATILASQPLSTGNGYNATAVVFWECFNTWRKFR